MRLAGEVSLRASTPFAAALAALHLAAFLLPWLSELDPALALAVDACVLVSVLLVSRQLLSQRDLVLRLHDAGHAELVEAGEVASVVLGPQSGVFAGFLVTLHWTGLADSRRRSACVSRFCLSASAWRLIARWLRWRLLSPDRPSA
jgi:hypothetical protein